MTLIVLAMAIPSVFMALRFRGDEDFRELRELYVFYLFGPSGPRIALVILAVLFAGLALSTVPRLLGGGIAVAIRPGGILLRSVLRTGFIPWEGLEGIGLSQWRLQGKDRLALKIGWRRLPGHLPPPRFRPRQVVHIPLESLAETREEVMDWVRAVKRARPKPVFAPPAPATRAWRVGDRRRA